MCEKRKFCNDEEAKTENANGNRNFAGVTHAKQVVCPVAGNSYFIVGMGAFMGVL